MTDLRDTTALMQSTMSGLVKIFPGCAVTLLVAPFNASQGSRVNYVSNAERADMLTALKELVARFEGRVHTTTMKQ